MRQAANLVKLADIAAVVVNLQMAHQAHQVSLVCQEAMDSQETQEPLDKTLHSCPRLTLTLNPAKLASLRKTVNLVHRDPLVSLDSLETPELLALAVVNNHHNRQTLTLLPEDLRLLPSVIALAYLPSGNTSVKLTASAKDLQARLARLDPMENLETQAHQESPVLQARSLTDHQWSDLQDQQDQQALPVPLESSVHPAHRAILAHKDNLESQETLVLQEIPEPQVALDSQAATEA